MSPDVMADRDVDPGHGPRIARTLEVVAVLARYNLARHLGDLGLGNLVPRRFRRDRPIGLAPEVAFRRALEDLGPTAVKLGQALATRGDILPEQWIEQLRDLQDQVTPVPFEELRAIMEDALGRPLEECFAKFDEEPEASGSIGQIHFAELHSGEKVAVKVRRPGIGRQVELDLSVLRYFAGLAEQRSRWIAQQRAVALVSDFARRLRGELDFGLEARNTALMAGVLEDDSRVRVPRVFTNWSSRKVLVTELVSGIKPSDREALESAGVDAPTVARNLAGALLKQIVRDGCFHADPHGGNILIAPGGGICFLDCGSVAFIPPRMRDDLVYLLSSMFEGDAEEVAAQITAIGLTTGETDTTALQADVARLSVAIHSTSTADVSIGDLLNELLFMIARHGIVMPPVFAQIIRTLVLVDAECRALDPRFYVREIARTVVGDTLRRRTRPRRAALEAYRVARNLHQHAQLLPRQLLALMRKADSVGLKIRLDDHDVDRPLDRFDVMFNRLAFSVVVAAMILAPAFWMQVTVDAKGWLQYMPYVLMFSG
ncbi:MAG TPA: AarF/UbiB family protein, partial [Armatimonadota bacterium]|nr:AarF/UbiB family protein [Armatimonadota bacterium]